MPNWWMIFSPNALFYFPGSDMMADEFSVLSDPFWPWWIWNWRLKRALGRRLDRLNQSIYIQLGGCIFLVSFSISLVCMCVGGGWEVRAALMILKWQGPEFFRTCGRAAAVAAAAFFVFLFFSLSPLFHPLLSVFIYRFIALHSYTHTHGYPHRHKRPPTLPFGWMEMEYLFHFLRSSIYRFLIHACR
jgi:hypothetical protein